ncbi:hypothetical protein CHS0354_041543, partial [Potamilus streckersoni]
MKETTNQTMDNQLQQTLNRTNPTPTVYPEGKINKTIQTRLQKSYICYDEQIAGTFYQIHPSILQEINTALQNI